MHISSRKLEMNRISQSIYDRENLDTSAALADTNALVLLYCIYLPFGYLPPPLSAPALALCALI